MKKIGFIDYFLDNYHGNNYPEWFYKYSDGDMCVECAYALAENPEGGMTNAEWSEKHGIRLASSAEEVIAASDYVMVLAPSYPETHEKLSELPLKSGKRVYIDKAFAPDLKTAKRMFDLAEKNDTPCCSASALAFVSEYEKFDRDKIETITSIGGGRFDIYAIHQFEPIVHLMKTQPKRIMSAGSPEFPSFVIEFADGRMVKTNQYLNAPFEMYVGYNDGTDVSAVVQSDMFENFIYKVIEYFNTGTPVAEKWQTLSVIALIDAARDAMKKPLTWVEICL